MSTQTLPNIDTNDDEWQDALQVSGLAQSTTVRIQNKSSDPIYIQFSPTKPTPDNLDGFILNKFQSAVIANEDFIWLLSDGRSLVFIEEVI